MSIQKQSDIINIINSYGVNVVKQYIKQRLDIYNDKWDYILIAELLDQFHRDTADRLNLLKTKEFNLLKEYVDIMSVVYKKPAVRTVKTENGDAEKSYFDYVNQSCLNQIMKKINHLTTLTNHTLLKVVWRDNKIDYDILTFDNVEIYVDRENSKKIKAVKYYVGLNLTKYGNYYIDKDNAKWDVSPLYDTHELRQFSDYHTAYMWTIEDDGSYIYKFGTDGNGNESLINTPDFVNGRTENPYKDEYGNPILPFVLVSSSYQSDANLDFTPLDGLVDATLSLAVNVTHLNELLKYQSHKQGILKISDPSKLGGKLHLGAGEWIVLTAGDTGEGAEILDMQADYATLWENGIKDRRREVLSQYGITPKYDGGQPMSGYAINMQRIALTEARENMIDLYRMYENDLFKKTKAVINYHKPNTIPNNAVFNIDFAEINVPPSPDETIKMNEFELKYNLKTEIDLIMERNPDLDYDSALKLYNKNREINEKLYSEKNEDDDNNNDEEYQ